MTLKPSQLIMSLVQKTSSPESVLDRSASEGNQFVPRKEKANLKLEMKQCTTPDNQSNPP